MKHLLLSCSMVLLLAAILTACSQTGVDPTATNPADARRGAPSSTSAVSGTCVKGTSETLVSASSLPAPVLAYLGTTYPGYTLLKAEQKINKAGTTYYEVEFRYNGKKKELYFDLAGAILPSSSSGDADADDTNEVYITADKLPTPVLTYLGTTYPGYTLVEAEQKTTKVGTTYYEVEFRYNGKKKELRFDANGALM